MIWTVSPVAFSLSLWGHEFGVRWYGLLFASTFVYGIAMFRYLFRREGYPVEGVYDLVLFVIAGTVVGARLGHVLLYNPQYYLANPLKILAVWEGGLASHGAVPGILVGVWLYSRTALGQSFFWICDRIALSVPLSGCLIRIGNFFNSEILGIPTDMPWAVVFERVDKLPRHPVQLYEALVYLAIFLLQWRYYSRRGDAGPEGYLTGRFFILVFGARFYLESFKEEQAAQAGWVFTMGQWLSLPMVLVGIFLLWRSTKPRMLPSSWQ